MQIRRLNKIKEYHTCEDIQKQVWQFEDREIIPVNELLTIQKNGGLVLGAFNKKSQVIGFVFGFPGISRLQSATCQNRLENGDLPKRHGNGELIHCSRMLAVLPEYRNTNIGYRLKLAQREFALKQDVNLISWTFDPLQGSNAYFNLEKLGVIVRRYHINLYGASSSILNRGMSTDRFLVEWWINSPRVRKAIKGERSARPTGYRKYIINKTKIGPDGFRICRRPVLNLTSPVLGMEIPLDIMKIKETNLRLARDWRLKTRKIFTTYLKQGYTVTGFIPPRRALNQNGSGRAGVRRSFYILSNLPAGR